MADENEGTSPEEQALADEWAAALAEAGDDVLHGGLHGCLRAAASQQG